MVCNTTKALKWSEKKNAHGKGHPCGSGMGLRSEVADWGWNPPVPPKKILHTSLKEWNLHMYSYSKKQTFYTNDVF